MALTTAGLNLIAQTITGQGIPLSSANAHIGVGNYSTAFDAAQTDLQGTSMVRKAMDAGYPIIDGNVVTFRSTFLPSEANFNWAEWGVFNAASGGTMLNRVSQVNGVKQSNQTWTIEVSVTFALNG